MVFGIRTAKRDLAENQTQKAPADYEAGVDRVLIHFIGMHYAGRSALRRSSP